MAMRIPKFVVREILVSGQSTRDDGDVVVVSKVLAQLRQEVAPSPRRPASSTG